MSVLLQQLLLTGERSYVSKHNSNYSAIESLLNAVELDVSALKAAGEPGADLDFRLGVQNLLVNGGFDYWQRGTTSRPDAWSIENNAINFSLVRSTSIEINTYSVKTTNVGQLTQSLKDLFRLSLETTHALSFAVYAKTSVEDNARIGIYDGTTTTYSDYHPGDGTFTKLTVNRTQGSGSLPSNIKFIMDATKAGDVYWNAAVVIRGNPSLGAVYVANDTSIEVLRVLRLYELGDISVSGVGYLNAGDRELRVRVRFISPKESVPTVLLVDDIDTGYDYDIEHITVYGFDIVFADVNGVSGTNGFEIENITWSAEVT